jgi:hypothetical protein
MTGIFAAGDEVKSLGWMGYLLHIGDADLKKRQVQTGENPCLLTRLYVSISEFDPSRHRTRTGKLTAA